MTIVPTYKHDYDEFSKQGRKFITLMLNEEDFTRTDDTDEIPLFYQNFKIGFVEPELNEPSPQDRGEENNPDDDNLPLNLTEDELRQFAGNKKTRRRKTRRNRKNKRKTKKGKTIRRKRKTFRKRKTLF